MTLDMLPALEVRLSGIEAKLTQLLGSLANPKMQREWYTVDEVAELLGKRPYTVREWCREGRINATKRAEKRGGSELWSIAADEVERIRNEGLMPQDLGGNRG
jgi:excisionase family DNA binding protein